MGRFLLLLGAAFAVTACSEHRPRITQEQLESQVEKRLNKGGYTPVNTYTPAVTQQTWKRNGAEIDIVYVAPAEKGRFPLLIYLPGLGENADAGSLWRTAWAKAGYAVLSLQARSLNASLWLPKESKSDKSAIAHQKFGAVSLGTRSEQLNWALTELRRLQQAENSPFKNADAAHAGLTGFELGAQLVAGLSGENLSRKLDPLPAGFTHEAGLLISPPFNLAEGKPDRRFANLNGPLLVVTASGDMDPNHITAQSTQQGFWQFAPPGDKFLLRLNGGAHGLLAGNPPKPDGGDANDEDDVWLESKAMRRPPSGGERFRSNLGLSGHSGGVSGGLGDKTGPSPGNGGNGAPPAGFSGGSDDTGMRAPTSNVELAAAIRSISIAFFDAILKHDPIARDWLEHNANPWLAKSGTLQAK